MSETPKSLKDPKDREPYLSEKTSDAAARLYQILGATLDDAGYFGTEQGQKALDLAIWLVDPMTQNEPENWDEELLPFPSDETVKEAKQELARRQEDCDLTGNLDDYISEVKRENEELKERLKLIAESGKHMSGDDCALYATEVYDIEQRPKK